MNVRSEKGGAATRSRQMEDAHHVPHGNGDGVLRTDRERNGATADAMRS
jgi:hypothetical protein